MNTVITPVYDTESKEFLGYDYNDELGDKVIMSLMRNNAFVPNIERVIYNTTKNDDGRWVLQTEVQFVDGTSSVVKNSILDEVKTEKVDVVLDDGTKCGTVVTASDESREMGLVYAVFKRILCTYATDGEDAGKVKGGAMYKFFKNIKSKTIVGEIHSKKLKAQKEREKQKLKEKSAKGSVISEEKKTGRVSKKKSFRDALRDITNVVETLAEIVNKSQNCKCTETKKSEPPVKTPEKKSKNKKK